MTEANPQVPLHPALSASLRHRAVTEWAVSEMRRAQIAVLSNFLKAELQKRSRLSLMFICKHNARRSQLSEAWARAIVGSLGLPVEVSSGGSAPTEVHPSVISALERAGFEVLERDRWSSVFVATTGPDAAPFELRSKRWDSAMSAGEPVVTVTNCSAAEESCPSVPGTVARLALLYDDPRRSDGKPEERATYEATSDRIGRELSLLFRGVADSTRR
jgi:arsenate reductase